MCPVWCLIVSIPDHCLFSYFYLEIAFTSPFRIFRRGCWGPGLIDKKKSDNVSKFSPQGFISRKTIKFLRFREGGGQTFSRGPIFYRRVQLLILMETYRNCDFPGSPKPLP